MLSKANVSVMMVECFICFTIATCVGCFICFTEDNIIDQSWYLYRVMAGNAVIGCALIKYVTKPADISAGIFIYKVCNKLICVTQIR